MVGWHRSIVCLLLLILPWTASGQTELRWKFKPKSAFTYETVSQLQQIVQTGTQEFKQGVKTRARTRYTVEKASDSETVLEMKVEAFEATLLNQDKPLPSAVRSELKEATFRLKLDANQKVVSVEGLDDFLAKATAEDPNLEKAMRLMMSKESLQTVAQQGFAFLPDKPVKVGDQWQRPLTVPLGPLGNFQITNTYTLENPEKKDGVQCQRIAVTCQVKYEAPKTLNLPFTIRSGTFQATEGKGHIWFDTRDGELIRSELKLALQGKLEIETQGKTRTLTLHQEQNVEVRRLITEE
jgi:hypothetical protein